jgi:hypothetical protein
MRWVVPIRYLLSTVHTIRYLKQRRPNRLIVTNPPLILCLVAFAYASRKRIPMVLDSHPGGFGAQGDRVSGRLQAIHRWLARRVVATMVTDVHWMDVLATWGARGLIVHEAPPSWNVKPASPIDGRPRVLFVGTFGGDEPIEVVFDAARQCREIDVLVTGDPRRCPPQLRANLPPNVRLTGFLQQEEFAAAVEAADVILTLSTEPTSVMRAAYEAVYACRPLVLSDWPGLRRLFPTAVAVANNADDLARGLRRAVQHRDELLALSSAAKVEQLHRWEAQLDELRSALNLT